MHLLSGHNALDRVHPFSRPPYAAYRTTPSMHSHSIRISVAHLAASRRKTASRGKAGLLKVTNGSTQVCGQRLYMPSIVMRVGFYVFIRVACCDALERRYWLIGPVPCPPMAGRRTIILRPRSLLGPLGEKFSAQQLQVRPALAFHRPSRGRRMSSSIASTEGMLLLPAPGYG